MNRRELFKGLAAAFVVAQIPIPIVAIESLPDPQAIVHLKNIRLDLINKIMSPPCILHEDNTLEIMSTKSWGNCLMIVNNLIKHAYPV